MHDEVKVRRVSDGAVITVTRKAFEVVLSGGRFELVSAQPKCDAHPLGEAPLREAAHRRPAKVLADALDEVRERAAVQKRAGRSQKR